MPIYPDGEDIKGWHDWLIEIYEEEEFPKKIEPGYNYEGQIDFIADFVTYDELYGEGFHATIPQKAAYYLFELCRSQAFNDGNKRTSLVVTYYFLLWNRHYFRIPPHADNFLYKIAGKDVRITYNDVFEWLKEHTIKSWKYIPRNLILLFLLPIWERFDIPLVDTIVDYFLFMPIPEFVTDILSKDIE